MKKLILALTILTLIAAVDASFILGNNSKIDTNYGPGGILSGFINISLQNQPSNSIFSTSLNKNISLINLLRNNSNNFVCNNPNCLDRYKSKNGATNKTFHLNYGEEKTISFLITTNSFISSITNLSLDVSASNSPSCINPLEIDILNDGKVDWQSDKFGSDFVCSYQTGTGCFDTNTDSSSAIIDDNKPYCEKISLLQNNKFKIGAWVKKGTGTSWHNGLLKMYLYDLDGSQLGSCDLPQPTSDGSEINCQVDYVNNNIKDYYVCIKGEDNSHIQGYETKIESNSSCGFYEFPGNQLESHDYYIYGRAAKYDSIGNFKLNQDEYAKYNNENLMTYVYNNFNGWGNCSSGCSIPIKFKAKQNMDIIISNAKLDYSSGAGPATTNLIYDTDNEKAKISSDFIQVGINPVKINAPNDFGTYNVFFYLDGAEILKQKISVLGIPNIDSIYPTYVPALVPINFVANVNSTSNLTYYWDFGDNTGGTGTKNTINHSYENVGNYQLKVTIKNNLGNSSKTVNVVVVSPKEAINDTIVHYRKNLVNIKNQINGFDSFVKAGVEDQLDVANLENEINKQESDYKKAVSDSEYVGIMNNLLDLEVPQEIRVGKISDGTSFFQNPDQIKLNALEVMGAGTIDENENKYSNSINLWIKDNLDIKFDTKVYYLIYKNKGSSDLFSLMKFELNPKGSVNDFYLGINGDPNKIKFNGNYNIKKIDSETVGVIFPEITQKEIVEFIYPERVDFSNIPVFVSPKFKNLEFNAEPGVCNSNNICEKDKGENYNNCRVDCKPWNIAILLWLILLLVAFIIYILLQEWYKRRYESYLFKNQIDLFNLINFMNNSLNQGLSMDEIFNKLREKGWSREQFNYAWRKLKGKRTGMWEIPIFKWVENKRVRKEIEKRMGKPNYMPINA